LLRLPVPASYAPVRRFDYTDAQSWRYLESLRQSPRLHIIGGGHVSLALSEVMQLLGFYISVYDDRAGLHTLEINSFADEKHVVPYEEIGARLQAGAQDFVVIMTFGYRPDKVVFRQLIGRDFFYLGMLGSEAKIKQLRKELAEEGLDPVSWRRVHAPIGLPIYSKTPYEIAISIAAEIIREQNRHLPTGRQSNRE
jgi:xanthine dehydrogenase accessory factor